MRVSTHCYLMYLKKLCVSYGLKTTKAGCLFVCFRSYELAEEREREKGNVNNDQPGVAKEGEFPNNIRANNIKTKLVSNNIKMK